MWPVRSLGKRPSDGVVDRVAAAPGQVTGSGTAPGAAARRAAAGAPHGVFNPNSTFLSTGAPDGGGAATAGSPAAAPGAAVIGAGLLLLIAKLTAEEDEGVISASLGLLGLRSAPAADDAAEAAAELAEGEA